MKYKILTLGCKVNSYESSAIDDLMKNNGYIKTDDVADIVIINTCTVTNTANNKSLKMVRHAVNTNKGAIIIVMGCATQIYKEDFMKIDGVSIILGNIGKNIVPSYIEEYLKSKKQIVDIRTIKDLVFEEMKLNNFNKTRAFVKIQDGCNNFCSYCIIPYTRGNIRSRNKDEILEEIRELIKNGHVEIVLTGIHTGHYGADLENYSLASLLKEIVKIEGLKRLRLSSIEITELTDEVLDILKNESVLVSHLHIPLQAGSDIILKSMNRKYDASYFEEKIKKIRSIRPDISITTDVIVGFPGETDKDFEDSLEFIKKIEFSKIHVFPYSRRSGTASDTFPNQISSEAKKQRVHILINLSRKLEKNYMSKFLNKKVSFIPETVNNGYIIGHTGNYLLVKTKENEVKEEVTVTIKKVDYPYVIGE